jgi:cell division protein FtsQ
MDGAGRLARSLRSLRPQADLKAAAIGAAVLLREWLAAKRASVKPKKRPLAQPRLQREPHPHRLIALLERYLPNQVGIAHGQRLIDPRPFRVVVSAHSFLQISRRARVEAVMFRLWRGRD